MILLMVDSKGSGKTTKLIKMANEALKNCSGDLVFIDNDHSHMTKLKHDIRYIPTKEFKINGLEEFYGFVSGIIAGDYDIERIFIDDLVKTSSIEIDKVENMVKKLEFLSEKYSVDLIITFNGNKEELSSFLKEYTE